MRLKFALIVGFLGLGPLLMSGGDVGILHASPAANVGGATGEITGTITDSGNSAPLSGINVSVYTTGGFLVQSTLTDGSGTYVVGGLPTGTYYARTFVSSTQNYIDELYNNLPCNGSCAVTSGAGIAVTDGVTTGGINFALAGGGTLTGSVVDAVTSAPLAGVVISLFDSTNILIKTSTTDGAGAFTMTGLPAGSYQAQTHAASVGNYVDELFNNVPCVPSCTLMTGSTVAVSVGSTTSGVDFALSPGGSISGTVTDAATSAPLATLLVAVFNSTGAAVDGVFTDGAGVFTVSGLPAGTYYARTFGSGPANYVDEVYDNRACVPACTLTAGAPIHVPAATAVTGINFALSYGGTITGTVTESLTNAPLSGVTVAIFNANGSQVSSAPTTGLGTFAISGLPTGTYYAATTVQDIHNYVNELFNNNACAPRCTVTAGTPISVTAQSTTSGVDFSLSPGGTIAGTVTDAVSTSPISNLPVTVFNATGTQVATLSTNSGGSYTAMGLPTGSYFARTFIFNSQNYLSEIFDDLLCTGACSVMVGTPIAVTSQGSATADFALSPGGVITGLVTDAVTGSPLSGLTVRAYTSTGILARTATTTSTGFTITGLSTGSYYVRTVNVVGYIDELFDNVPCVRSCLDPATLALSTPVSVAAGATHSGIDFALTLGGRVAGRATDSVAGAPIPGVGVNVYDATGRLAAVASADASGNYITLVGLPTGTYYARTFNPSGYIDEVFDNHVLCLASCAVTSGTSIGVTVGAVTGGIDFVLTPGTELIRNGDFASGTEFWSLFATPNVSYLDWQAPTGTFQFVRVPPPPGTANQAVILQPTGAALSPGTPILAQFDLANTSGVRKRVSVLVHDSDFSDLSVCTFWLPANSLTARYGMRTHNTKTWSSATISFYAASAGSDGGFYALDNVSLQAGTTPLTESTDCLDPIAPGTAAGADGPELLVNGNFATGTLSGWSTFGQLVDQVNGGVFEFYRPSATPDPAGVILQPTSTAVAAGGVLSARFELGNSSAVRKRVTVLVHDLDFSDLSACTFWLAPNQALSSYTMRAFATKAWANATISIYAATAGNDTWMRLDNVSLRQTPGSLTNGTDCLEPAGGGGSAPAPLAWSSGFAFVPAPLTPESLEPARPFMSRPAYAYRGRQDRP